MSRITLAFMQDTGWCGRCLRLTANAWRRLYLPPARPGLAGAYAWLRTRCCHTPSPPSPPQRYDVNWEAAGFLDWGYKVQGLGLG